MPPKRRAAHLAEKQFSAYKLESTAPKRTKQSVKKMVASIAPTMVDDAIVSTDIFVDVAAVKEEDKDVPELPTSTAKTTKQLSKPLVAPELNSLPRSSATVASTRVGQRREKKKTYDDHAVVEEITETAGQEVELKETMDDEKKQEAKSSATRNDSKAPPKKSSKVAPEKGETLDGDLEVSKTRRSNRHSGEHGGGDCGASRLFVQNQRRRLLLLPSSEYTR